MKSLHTKYVQFYVFRIHMSNSMQMCVCVSVFTLEVSVVLYSIKVIESFNRARENSSHGCGMYVEEKAKGCRL